MLVISTASIHICLILYEYMAAHPKTEFHSQMFLVHLFRRDDFGIHDEVALTIFAPTYFRSYILDRHVPSSYSSKQASSKVGSYNIGFCCSPPHSFRENIYQTECTRTKKKEFDESSSSHLLANKRAKTRSNVGTGWTFRISSSRSHSPIVSAMLASIPGLRPRPNKIMHIRKNQINHPPIITET